MFHAQLSAHSTFLRAVMVAVAVVDVQLEGESAEVVHIVVVSFALGVFILVVSHGRRANAAAGVVKVLVLVAGIDVNVPDISVGVVVDIREDAQSRLSRHGVVPELLGKIEAADGAARATQPVPGIFRGAVRDEGALVTTHVAAPYLDDGARGGDHAGPLAGRHVEVRYRKGACGRCMGKSERSGCGKEEVYIYLCGKRRVGVYHHRHHSPIERPFGSRCKNHLYRNRFLNSRRFNYFYTPPLYHPTARPPRKPLRPSATSSSSSSPFLTIFIFFTILSCLLLILPSHNATRNARGFLRNVQACQAARRVYYAHCQ